jgi:hypothetical protein
MRYSSALLSAGFDAVFQEGTSLDSFRSFARSLPARVSA